MSLREGGTMWVQNHAKIDQLLRGRLPEILILDKAYTRTYSQDDSFVANIRRTLPREIPAGVFEHAIAASIPGEHFEFLCNYYGRIDGGEAYMLRSIPRYISAELMAQHTGDGAFAESDRQFLFRFYTLDGHQGRYALTGYMTEADEIRVLKLFNMKSLHISNVEKATVSQILSQVAEVPRKDIFFANMHVPRNHKFFSPPNLKHISGMQITEAARQFAIACHHIYGGVPLTDVTFLLESLASEFYQYAKVNLPVKMRAILKEVKLDKQNAWRNTEFEITAYQQNMEISKVITRATILPLKIYRKLKSGQEEVYEIDPRFHPNDRVRISISIRYTDGDEPRKWDCRIVNFSKGGFQTRSDGKEPPLLLLQNPRLEFFMHFDQAGFVYGRCKNVWTRMDEDDVCWAGFAITEMSGIDRETLSDAIVRFGRLVEGREIQ